MWIAYTRFYLHSVNENIHLKNSPYYNHARSYILHYYICGTWINPFVGRILLHFKLSNSVLSRSEMRCLSSFKPLPKFFPQIFVYVKINENKGLYSSQLPKWNCHISCLQIHLFNKRYSYINEQEILFGKLLYGLLKRLSMVLGKSYWTELRITF